MPNPFTPHPITITVFSSDNSTLKSGAFAYVANCSKKTKSNIETTNSSGVAIIDLANLPVNDGQSVPYATGDKILIISYGPDGSDNCHDASLYTVSGESKDQTLYLNPIVHTGGNVTVRLMGLYAENPESAYKYVKVYSITDGALLAHMNVAATSARDIQFTVRGMGCNGGFVVERETQTVTVTAIIK